MSSGICVSLWPRGLLSCLSIVTGMELVDRKLVFRTWSCPCSQDTPPHSLCAHRGEQTAHTQHKTHSDSPQSTG